MSRSRHIDRSLALGAGLIMAFVASLPVVAAEPPAAAPDFRPTRPAWEKAAPDDRTRLIVTFKARTSAAVRSATIARADATRVTSLPGTRSVAIRAEAGGAARAIASLRADPRVARVTIDHRRFLAADPTGEPGWRYLWGMHNTGQSAGDDTPGGTPDVDIDGKQAIGVTTGSSSVVVAVIDDGLDFSHPDLAARAWTNPGESGAGREDNGVDDDANGYIDDVNGWDFCHDDNTVHDFGDDFHGTHVAGTIAASLDGDGIVGVAPNIKLMALKFLGGSDECGLDSAAIEAIAYAKSFGVRIANASWSGRGAPDEAPDLYEAIEGSGMLFVAAAGNADPGDSGHDNDDPFLTTLPASFDLPNIISVAAVGNTGDISYFSNYGETTVDISAPGESILSALPADEFYPDPGWGWLDGTSMAAPHVSGTAALVISRLPSLASDPVALKARLMHTGKAAPFTTGQTVSGRIVDAYRALDETGAVANRPTSFAFEIGRTMGASTISTRVGWPVGTDDRNGVNAYGLARRAGSGPWVTTVEPTSSLAAVQDLTLGTTYGLRVRARDRAGNWGAFSGSSDITAKRRQESAASVDFSSGWRTSLSSSASAGKARYTSRSGASVTFHFTGRAFALIAPKGPARGTARLYVDGRYVSTVNLHANAMAPRIVVAGRSWSSSASHTVKLVVVGTGSHPRFDVDAFAILR